MVLSIYWILIPGSLEAEAVCAWLHPKLKTAGSANSKVVDFFGFILKFELVTIHSCQKAKNSYIEIAFFATKNTLLREFITMEFLFLACVKLSLQ